MANGHGGLPRFGAPILLALLLGLTMAGVPPVSLALRRFLALGLAVLLGWRLAYHIHFWDVTAYGGAMTPIERLRYAERRYWLATPFYVLAAVALVLLWYRP